MATSCCVEKDYKEWETISCKSQQSRRSFTHGYVHMREKSNMLVGESDVTTGDELLFEGIRNAV